ncbi:MAG TPA: hypothetical protein VK892_00530 [Pyrinomonadaceae bacterium]|nr:hypothetical protein [Pyrinomonadaceae bacterium]
MQQITYQNKFNRTQARGIKLLPILSIWAAVLVSAFVFLIFVSDELNPIREFYLFPWVLLTGVVVAMPNVYLWYRNSFHLFHPLTLAAWSYFLPAFFAGGLILAAGFSEPYYLAFIQNIHYDLPLTMLVIMLGYIGLTIGFFLPLGRKLGEAAGKMLPNWEWKPENLFFPGFVLLILGFFNNIFGFVVGVLGYQKLAEIGQYDGMLFLMTLLWLQASFLLWLVLFKRNKLDFNAVLTVGVLMVTGLLKALYAGNRGGLYQLFILIFMAYLLSGRQFKLKQGMIAGGSLILVIFIGMIYGTTFRSIKGTEEQVGVDQYTENIFATFEEVGKRDNVKTLEQGFSSLAERLDTVSVLAVVVSNYEDLKPYEEGYGLDNNIWKDTATFFIPRVVWADKPVASEPRLYSELYFDYGENSFPITPMGDLLRNYGFWGVFLGMALLGFVLRLIYVSLMDIQPGSIWRITFFYMLLTSVSYEGFYGTIIPYFFKVGFISMIGILIVHFLVKKSVQPKF